MKHALHKEIWQSFKQSRGRFLSILCLMFLGSFALVGLKAVKPNVEAMLTDYFAEARLMDLAILSDYGLSEADQQELLDLPDTTIEFGYFTDVAVANSTQAIRLYSRPQQLSLDQLVTGRLPQASDEIALHSNLEGVYHIGDTITFTNKKSAVPLTTTEFTVTGFVTSPEILSNTAIGTARAGTGELAGYGVVLSDVFDSEIYTIARLHFHELAHLSPLSDTYQTQLHRRQKTIDTLLADNGTQRYKAIQADVTASIDDAQQQIDEAQSELSSAETALSSAQHDIDSHQSQLDSGTQTLAAQDETLSQAATELANAEVTLQQQGQQLQEAKSQIDQTALTLAQQKQLLDANSATLYTAKTELDAAQSQLDAALTTLTTTKSTLDAQAISLEATRSTIATNETNHANEVALLQQQIDELTAQGIDPTTVPDIVQKQANLTTQASNIQTERQTYGQQQAQYQTALSQYETEFASYTEQAQQHAAALATYTTNKTALDTGMAQYEQALAQWQQYQSDYTNGLAEWNIGDATLTQQAQQYANGVEQLEAARRTLSSQQSELDAAQQQLNDETATFQTEKASAQAQIQEAKQAIQEAQVALRQLSVPTYHSYDRSTALTSAGYRMVSGSVEGIHSVGNLFPVILYLVAALVTMTTMTRFVNEERGQLGLLTALGYSPYDILKKFALHGLAAGIIGTVLGILAGTYLFPAMIIATLFAPLALPNVPLQFHWDVSLIALFSSIVCSTLPPLLIARKSLKETPAHLLLPKPPANGAKIWLEYIPIIWRRLTFTQKVTFRNIFRYKQRMLMTIFGVAGSVALLFAGLGITTSLNHIVTKQYGELMHYDLIVSMKPNLTASVQQALQDLLHHSAVQNYQALHLEAHAYMANHEATLIVMPSEQLQPFITLRNRQTQQPLQLDQTGVIVSEYLAELAHTAAQGTLSLKVQQTSHDLPIAYIAELYAGHFVFMTPSYYAETFGKEATANAYFVTLNDTAATDTKAFAAQLMALDAVTAVTHNAMIIEQVESVVASLSTSMQLLTAVSIFLAIIILYNLTTINIAERIRELSTIKVLGFQDWETTRYIYRETILLSLIGIVVGILSGQLLHRLMITTIRPDHMMFDPAIDLPIYLIPPIIIIGILLLLGAIVHYTLKHVDMLEALKANE